MSNSSRAAATSPRALVVDDEPSLVRVVVGYLQADGFEVDSAPDGPTALDLARRTDPDVIVLDLQLPHVDGWELARRIKSNPALRDVPLVAFSACVMPTERAMAEEAGFDLFLGKPCDPSIILREVRRLLTFRHAR